LIEGADALSPAPPVSVWVTRPALLAAPTIGALRARGYAVVHEPLLTLVPTAAPRPLFDKAPYVVITSGAVCHIMADRKDDSAPFLNCPCYCVGQQTAATARSFGFSDIRRAARDAEDLARCFIRQERDDRPVLYLCGEEREPVIETHLSKAGWRVVPWAVYKADATRELGTSLRMMLEHRKVDAVLFYSLRTASAFAALMRKEDLTAFCEHLFAFALSAKVASGLQGLPLRGLAVSALPTQADMLTCLETLCPAHKNMTTRSA